MSIYLKDVPFIMSIFPSSVSTAERKALDFWSQHHREIFLLKFFLKSKSALKISACKDFLFYWECFVTQGKYIF